MTSLAILKVKHMLRQGMSFNLIGLLAIIVLTYLVVLAINAAQIAVAEKYRP